MGQARERRVLDLLVWNEMPEFQDLGLFASETRYNSERRHIFTDSGTLSDDLVYDDVYGGKEKESDYFPQVLLLAFVYHA